MKKQTGILISFLLILNFNLNASGGDNRDSLWKYEPGRDSSLSVRKITNVRERFEQKNKHNYLDYIQNQNASAQSGSFWIDGSGIVNGNMLIGTSTDAGYKLDISGTARFKSNTSIMAIISSHSNASGVRLALNSQSYLGVKRNAGIDYQANSSGRWFAGINEVLEADNQDFVFTNYQTGVTPVTFKSSGNVLIGTTADNGFKLNVNGNTRSNQFWASDIIEVQKTFGIDAGLRLYDPSGGYMTMGGGSSSGFTPTIKMHPDATWNMSSIFSITSDAGSYPAIVLDGRTTTGPLATKDVLWIGSYLNPYIKVKANGNTLIGTPTDAGYKLNVGGGVFAKSSALVTSYTESYPFKFMSSHSDLFEASVSIGNYGNNGSFSPLSLKFIGAGRNYSDDMRWNLVADDLNSSQNTSVLYMNFKRIDGSSINATNRSLIKWANNDNVLLDLKSNGNVLIGNATDAGYKLDVNGTGRFSGNIYGNTNMAYLSMTQSGGSILSFNGTDIMISSGRVRFNFSGTSVLTYDNLGLTLGTMTNEINDPDKIVVNSGGVLKFMTKSQLGIGTSSTANAWSLTGNSSITSDQFIGTTAGNTQPLIFKTNGSEAFRVNSTGQISIGTNDPKTYKLAVNGDAIFTKVKVKQYPWADYVFDDDYKLPTLKDVEEYIKKHKHLPEVPSAKEVEQNGLDVGDNQATLLKKIEELTLYIIEINKKVDKLSEENETLKKKVRNN